MLKPNTRLNTRRSLLRSHVPLCKQANPKTRIVGEAQSLLLYHAVGNTLRRIKVNADALVSHTKERGRLRCVGPSRSTFGDNTWRNRFRSIGTSSDSYSHNTSGSPSIGTVHDVHDRVHIFALTTFPRGKYTGWSLTLPTSRIRMGVACFGEVNVVGA